MLGALNAGGTDYQSVQMVDSTVIRTHQHGAGGKGGLKTKYWPFARWLIDQNPPEDKRSWSLSRCDAIAKSALFGEVSDMKGFGPVMAEPGPFPKVLIADKGYNSDLIRSLLAEKRIESIIPPRRNRKIQNEIDGHIYSLRNLIERCFAKLKQSRRLATRYDTKGANYVGFVFIALTQLWIRHFVNTP